MRKLSALFILFCFTLQVAAQQNPVKWLRQSSISPDGQTIAFAWQGDIFTVNINGGEAKQLTSHPSHESNPLWTADGKEVIFSSEREGTADLWAVSAEGGAPRRITTYNGSEKPIAVGPDGTIYFTSNIQYDVNYSNFPNTPQLYSVSQSGGKIRQVTSLPISNLSINASGVMLYEDRKGVEDPLRKHHTSSVTRDIWKFDPADGTYTKLSSFIGENRNPVFAPDGVTYYFLSEQSGDFNVWKASLDGSKAEQITKFKDNPVRYLSIAGDGTMVFSYNGELYTLKDGSEPRKIEVSIAKDSYEREKIFRSSTALRSLSPSPKGKEVALISRGDVYVTSVEGDFTARITDTPEQERGVSFSKDGRTIYYASERNGEWGIWRSSLENKKDNYFCISQKFKEERFTKEGETCFQPAVSPDGKWVAFLRDRTEVVIKKTNGGGEKSLLKGVNYSYTDGDQSFEWSPDSRYLLCTYMADGGWNHEDVALINIEDGSIINLTESGYSDDNFRWAMKGKAMTWQSDKAGFRSHGSWGAEGDIYLMFFDDKEFANFKKTEKDTDFDKLIKSADKKAEKKEKKDSLDKEKKSEKLELELERRDDRIVRLTSHSGRLGDYYLTDDGEKLYYTVLLEKSLDLCCLDVKKKSIKVIKKGFYGAFIPSLDGKELYALTSLGAFKVDVKGGTLKEISFKGEYEYFPYKEREYIFNHVWKQVVEKFYDPQIHGVDWAGIKENYALFLPYINNSRDFVELLSEMLGELNASHTGARYYNFPLGAPGVARIGVIFDEEYNGKGLKIKELLRGGALSVSDPEIKAGDLILAVNGKEIEEGTEWYTALERTTGKRTMLTVKKGHKTEEIYLTPNSSDAELLYKRWVRHNEEMVARLSGGKVGYVHVRGMDSGSFREVYSKVLGKYRSCGAVIIDTRHNGGGWLHDDLASLLNGKAYLDFKPRGQYISTEPYSKWTKPSCVLIGEDNYSDACGFPFVYKTLGIGKLIGAPVPGTMTAVWWERQIDPTIVFGIPQVGAWSYKDNRYLENLQIEPDILVYNDPASILRGEDKQIEAAVAEMLREIGE